MTDRPAYSYLRSKKSDASDEIINTYLIRPLAGLFVRLVYPTDITPNQVTVASIVMGLFSAASYFHGTPVAIQAGGFLLLLKDILDSADGQLARARQQFSRRGRFLDSIGDFLVSLAVLMSIGAVLARLENSLLPLCLAFVAFLGLTLRVSYHVFYQTSFLHLQQTYATNRITEEVQSADLHQDAGTLRLQRIFFVLYGWQDRMMLRLDQWSKRGRRGGDEGWYGDRVGIRWSGALGLGTENATIAIFSFFVALPEYLLFNLTMMNCVWLGCILYRRMLAGRISPTTG